MGQKTHPYGFRIGVIKTWQSRWYADKEFGKWLHEDLKLRKFIKQTLLSAGVSKIEFERASTKLKVIIRTARPGLVIGKKGAGIEDLKKQIQKQTDKEVFLDIVEVRRPEIDAQLVAENIAMQLERRVAFRRAMKKALTMAFKFGAKGIKIMCAGRLAGAEIARTEWYSEGSVPLHTLRADIDFGFAEALTTYGLIGVKVWINKGEVLKMPFEVPEVIAQAGRAGA
ncbi:MAG TPA: 30S ribosomal protein S3 [Bdellovibrionota bacterium]|nr:30S ribosomal protein S3 [Bdellovibrionota bacterium]